MTDADDLCDPLPDDPPRTPAVPCTRCRSALAYEHLDLCWGCHRDICEQPGRRRFRIDLRFAADEQADWAG